MGDTLGSCAVKSNIYRFKEITIFVKYNAIAAKVKNFAFNCHNE